MNRIVNPSVTMALCVHNVGLTDGFTCSSCAETTRPPLVLDDTELVEVAGKTAWEYFRSINLESLPVWEDLNGMEKYNVREGVFPVVMALVKHIKETNA